jgi:hypothetical protein
MQRRLSGEKKVARLARYLESSGMTLRRCLMLSMAVLLSSFLAGCGKSSPASSENDSAEPSLQEILSLPQASWQEASDWRVEHMIFDHVFDAGFFASHGFPINEQGRAVIKASELGTWHFDGTTEQFAQTLLPGDTDKPGDQHTLSFSKARNILLKDCEIHGDGGVEEALKFSASQFVVVSNCVLYGGKEDALDVVRGRNYVFRDVHFHALGDQGATVKASIKNLLIYRSAFHGRPRLRHVDEEILGIYHPGGTFIDIGNWSDYDVISRPATTGVKIDASFEDRKANAYDYKRATYPVQYWPFAAVPFTTGAFALAPTQLPLIGGFVLAGWRSSTRGEANVEEIKQRYGSELSWELAEEHFTVAQNQTGNHEFFAGVRNHDDYHFRLSSGEEILSSKSLATAFVPGDRIYLSARGRWFELLSGETYGTAHWKMLPSGRLCQGEAHLC